MKRILTLSVLALAVMAATEQKAQAWSKHSFNVGLSWQSEKADNNFMWGLYRNGPVPGSQGHGIPSSITHHGSYPGGGYCDMHGAAPFGGGFPHAGLEYPFAPSRAISPNYSGAPVMPYASTPSQGESLPLPGQSMPQRSTPVITPASYQWQPNFPPMPFYYWPGN